MFVRALLLSFALATPAIGQGIFKRPPKPKVVATPTPAPAVPTPKPPVKKRPAPKPDEPAAAPLPAAVSSYMPKVKAAFAARWDEAKLAAETGGFVSGTVSVLFTLDAEGKVTAVKITENTSNEAFGKFCEKFVNETPFEMPPGKALVDGAVEIPFTFRIY